MKSLNIGKFLPDPTEEKSQVHTELPASLHAQVREQFVIDKENRIKMTWETLLEAAAKAYLIERGRKIS